MAKTTGQKVKLLQLYRILWQDSDETHGLSMAQLIERLRALGIKAERKAIYNDLEALRSIGCDIVARKSSTTEYFLGSRPFELAELKLLVDAVQAAKFITHTKSLVLIAKLTGLTSTHQAAQLRRQVYVTGRVKTMNQSIYYTVDTLHAAIAAHRCVAFQYVEYTPDKRKRLRRGGHSYRVSPHALVWEDENYYLIATVQQVGVRHFRVDKITAIELLPQPSEPLDTDMDLAAYIQNTFSMFGGEEARIRVRFANELIGVLIDRFGTNVEVRPQDGTHFIARLRVHVSAPFLAWLMQFGERAQILSPEPVVQRMRELVQSVSELYLPAANHTREGVWDGDGGSL